MKKLTMIHAIENKYEHKFERQLKTYLQSLKFKNTSLLEEADIVFVQPTINDVTKTTVDFIKSSNARFVKTLEKDSQTNKNQNFTNNINSIVSIIDDLETEYICWTDTDIIFLRNEPGFFKDTDSIVVSILPLIPSKEISEYKNAGEIDTGSDMNLLYLKYFKDHLPEEYRVNNLDYYTNTWLVYGKRKSNFWIEWHDLTHLLIKVIQKNHPEQVDLGLESICEELACSILYQLQKYKLENVSEFFGNNRVSMNFTTDPGLDFKSDCSLLHYNMILVGTMPELIGDFKKDSLTILEKMLQLKLMTNKEYLSSIKQLT
jgi:hypothetical protein